MNSFTKTERDAQYFIGVFNLWSVKLDGRVDCVNSKRKRYLMLPAARKDE